MRFLNAATDDDVQAAADHLGLPLYAVGMSRVHARADAVHHRPNLQITAARISYSSHFDSMRVLPHRPILSLLVKLVQIENIKSCVHVTGGGMGVVCGS